jgi:hypothetical protein
MRRVYEARYETRYERPYPSKVQTYSCRYAKLYVIVDAWVIYLGDA